MLKGEGREARGKIKRVGSNQSAVVSPTNSFMLETEVSSSGSLVAGGWYQLERPKGPRVEGLKSRSSPRRT